MNQLAEHRRLLKKTHWYSSLVFVLVVVAGVMGTLFAAIATDLSNRADYRIQVDIISQGLSLEDIKALSANSSDLSKKEYARLRGKLAHAKDSDRRVSSVYLLGKKQDRIVTLADSEQLNTPDNAFPGEVYQKPQGAVVSALDSSDGPAVHGPFMDQEGDWQLTALTPIKDPATGSIVALAAIDVPATNYYFQIVIFSLVPLLLAAIPLAGLIRDHKIEAKEREILGLKSQFVSIASHELRSPLNGMLWAIQSLLQKVSTKNKDVEELLHDMYRSAASSLATVNEILDFSIFERSKEHKMQREQVDLAAVMNEAVKTLKLGASEKDLAIKWTGKWPEKIMTVGDVAALKRSYMNVLSNAIKYSPDHASIHLDYEEQSVFHVIAIKDEGIGIPKEEQKKVLEGYYRATNAVKVQSSGTGLGLWVSRLVVEQHKGKLWIASQERKGTTVYIALPKSTKDSPKPA